MSGWLKYESSVVSSDDSAPPQLLLISVAFKVAASSSAAYRLLSSRLFASTNRILHSGHAAETISISSDISRPQSSIVPNAPCGYLSDGYSLSSPFWLTFSKQPFALVQAVSVPL